MRWRLTSALACAADSDWLESNSGVVSLPTISTTVLELVVRLVKPCRAGRLPLRLTAQAHRSRASLQAEYLIYKDRYTREDAPTGEKVPNFQVSSTSSQTVRPEPR